MTSKIILGSAQLGGNYGITNTSPSLDIIKIKEIISYAKSMGIDTIDTAISYESISNFHHLDLSGLKINTKLPKIPLQTNDINDWVQKKINLTLKNLNISKIDCLFLHNPNQLLQKKGKLIIKSLENLKQKKLINKIGVSIYDPLQLENLSFIYNFDVIQSPFNLLDRRLINSGWLKKAHAERKEVQVRSIFLQGLLLLSEDKLPREFFKWKNLWRKLDLFCDKRSISKLDLLLSFVKSFKEIDKIILGIDNLQQLKEIDASLNKNIEYFPNIYSLDEELINPLNWTLYKKNKAEF